MTFDKYKNIEIFFVNIGNSKKRFHFFRNIQESTVSGDVKLNIAML